MPTLLTEGGLRFFFDSNEGDPREPSHVHVASKDGGVAKYWLVPVALADSSGMNRRDLSRALEIVQRHAQSFKESWDAHFHA